MFSDCFGNKLEDGDDVIISIGRKNLHCGIVWNVTDSRIDILYQYWKGEEERSRKKTFMDGNRETCKINSLYKIDNK